MIQKTEVSELTISQFFDLIYGKSQGVACIAIKSETGTFSQSFYNWPSQEAEMIRFIESAPPVQDVYYTPALFKTSSRSKDAFLTSNVIWAEFDGNAQSFNTISTIKPTLIIQSSEPGYEHWYWKLDHPVTDGDYLEQLNKHFVEELGADFCWDVSRLLRPIGTTHTESGNIVAIKLYRNEAFVNPKLLGLTKQALNNSEDKFHLDESTASYDEIVAKYPFDKDTYQLLTLPEVKVGKRSSTLVKLVFSLIRLGLSNGEILELIEHTDSRWGKFSKRADKLKRYKGLLTYCRKNLPVSELKSGVVTLDQLLKSEINIDWVIPSVIHRKGIVMLTGPPEVGKTQFTLRTAMALAAGQVFINWPVGDPAKVLFISLEMGDSALKSVISIMLKDYSKEHQELIRSNLYIYPLGYGINLAQELPNLINAVKPTGVFVDSFSQSVKSLVEDDVITSFFSSMRKSCENNNHYLWFIHHNRKTQIHNRRPKTLDDVYGSRFISASVDTGYALWPSKGGAIELYATKTRFGPKPDPMFIKRTSTLNFVPSYLNPEPPILSVNSLLTEFTSPVQGGSKPSLDL